MTRGARARLTAATLMLFAVMGAGPAPVQDPEADGSGEPSASEEPPEGTEPAFTIADPAILESSGLAASAVHEGVYWTHNDSGPDYGPDIYAVDERGETVATVRLSGDGVEARDWEGIAVGVDDTGASAVYVADIGDNFQGGWPTVRVYRLPEPQRLTDQTVPATTFTLSYADGGRDAEGILVDPRDNRLYVVSKELGGGVYAAPEQLDPEGANTLTRIGPAPLYATDAAFSPDGTHYAIRTYWSVALYDASEGMPGTSTNRLPLPRSDQGESMTYTRDGTALLVGSEGPASPVWRVPLPEEAAETEESAPPSEARSPSPTGEEEARPHESGATTLILGGAGIAVVVILAIVWLARKG